MRYKILQIEPLFLLFLLQLHLFTCFPYLPLSRPSTYLLLHTFIFILKHFHISFVFLTLVKLSPSKSVLTDNGYMNLVVGISPDVPESQDIIDNIKHLLTEASRELFTATRNRAYFDKVKILLPQTWSMAYDQELQGEIYEDAELRVDRPNPVYADAPYTVRGAECGDPGSHIHFTPGDILSFYVVC